jgi:CRP/FNR family nitrogen fixation transcriptional regulator
MSISEPQALNATACIAFHARFEASEVFFGKNQKIHGECEPAHFIYEVARGAARSYKLLSDGRRQICAFHFPGDIFGLEDAASYRFTTEAIVETTARVIRRHSLEYAAARDIAVANNLLNLAAETLLHAENHMLLLGQKNSLEKVVAFLLEMNRRLARTSMIALPMCRRDIADYLGLTLETVSRALSYLRDKRVIGFSDAGQREIVLQDRRRLQEFDS